MINTDRESHFGDMGVHYSQQLSHAGADIRFCSSSGNDNLNGFILFAMRQFRHSGFRH